MPKKTERLGDRAGSSGKAGRSDRVATISELRPTCPLATLLQIAHIPRSSYYYHASRLPRIEKRVPDRQAIRKICAEHKGRYGYRRGTLTLRQQGYPTNHKLVMKLMREEHLSGELRP